MKIDTSSLQKLGNMTSGSGLSAIFNSDISTGYSQSTLGWAGVSLASSSSIGKALLTSPDNGFDASGSTSVITLNLYGKKGAAPVSATDGVLLGTISFTDVNEVTTKEIQSSDNATQFDHVWVSVATGVWAILANVELYDTAIAVPTYVVASAPVIIRKSNNDREKLNFSGVELSGFRCGFELKEAATAVANFDCAFKHTGTCNNGAGSYTKVVGVGIYLLHRSASTAEALQSSPWQSDENMVTGTNLYDQTQHYCTLHTSGPFELDAGFHEFGILATNHTDALPMNDTAQVGIVEVLAEGSATPYKGRNMLMIDVRPVTPVIKL